MNWSAKQTEQHIHPIRTVGPHNGAEVFRDCALEAQEVDNKWHPQGRVLYFWLTSKSRQYFDVAEADWIWLFCLNGINLSLTFRLLTVRNEWSRK